LDSFLARVQDGYRQGLVVTVDGIQLELKLDQQSISMLTGAGNLNTLRIECAYKAMLHRLEAGRAYQLRFEDTKHIGRMGWHELVVQPAAGISIFDSSAYGNAVTDELKAYPQDALAAPLDERPAELSFMRGRAAPAGSRPLVGRDGRQCVPGR